MSDGPILSVRGLVSGYVDENVLHGVSLDVPEVAIVAVIGPNGCGKSTMLKTIYGLVRPRAGEVRLRGEGGERDIAGLRPHEITRLGVNMVPQLANVFPELTVRENLQVGADVVGGRFGERLDRVVAIFPALAGMLAQRAATLSGGQRQMVAIARAMITGPRLLILDEPSAGLAPAVADEMFATVQRVNAQGVSILMVEQRARQCLAIADHGYVLDMGRNRIDGTGAALLADPAVVDAYLGSRGRIERIAERAAEGGTA